VRGIDASVISDFLEPDRGDGPGQSVEFGQPVGKAQVSHTAAIIAPGLEAGRAAGDQAVEAAQRPACGGPEVESED
jgi:hypothetical protein